MPVFLFLAGKWLRLALCAVSGFPGNWQSYVVSDARCHVASGKVTKHFLNNDLLFDLITCLGEDPVQHDTVL